MLNSFKLTDTRYQQTTSNQMPPRHMIDSFRVETPYLQTEPMIPSNTTSRHIGIAHPIYSQEHTHAIRASTPHQQQHSTPPMSQNTMLPFSLPSIGEIQSTLETANILLSLLTDFEQTKQANADLNARLGHAEYSQRLYHQQNKILISDKQSLCSSLEQEKNKNTTLQEENKNLFQGIKHISSLNNKLSHEKRQLTEENETHRETINQQMLQMRMLQANNEILTLNAKEQEKQNEDRIKNLEMQLAAAQEEILKLKNASAQQSAVTSPVSDIEEVVPILVFMKASAPQNIQSLKEKFLSYQQPKDEQPKENTQGMRPNF
ncbi:MAG: hypothetical protein AB7D28_07125 [Candidatus Berkiella sp.]